MDRECAIDFSIAVCFDSYVTIICHIKFVQTGNTMSLIINSNGSRVLKLRLIPWTAFLFTFSFQYLTAKTSDNTMVFQLADETNVEADILVVLKPV